MAEVTCVSAGVYSDALTRGKRYAILEVNKEKEQVRITGDNKRARWYPFYHFDFENHPIVSMKLFCLDDPIWDEDANNSASVDVTIKFSNGERRWCYFMTPNALAQSGDWFPDTNTRFHYDFPSYAIFVTEITPEIIQRVLLHMEHDNKLMECTTLLKDYNDEDEDFKE